MKRCLQGLLLFAVIVSFAAAGMLIAAEKAQEKKLEQKEEQEIPEEILIENEGYKQDKKGAVLFSHLEHAMNYSLGCEECHHNFENGKNIWKEGDHVNRCFECHDPRDNQDNVKKLMLAYHRLCGDCHRKLVKEGSSKTAPYKKCYECHQKRPQ